MVDGTSRNRLRINNSETVFNDGGRDLDFRVESDTQSHMLFVDAGNNHVNMGASADYGGRLNVVTGDNTTTLALVSTDADASVGPKLLLRRDSASPADNDNAGQIVFTADNDAGEATTYGFIRSTLEDITDGTEDGILDIQTITAGSTRSRVKVAGAETVINESSQDLDFRVESDADTQPFLFKGLGFIGVGTSSPAAPLHLKGAGGCELHMESGDGASTSVIKHNQSTDALEFYPDGSLAMTLQAGNQAIFESNVGIGASSIDLTSSGRTVVQVEGSSNALLNLTDGTSRLYLHQKGGTSGADIWNSANSYMRFATNDTERMRIDSSGNVGIGTSSPSNNLQVGDATDATEIINIASTGNGYLTFGDAADNDVGFLQYNHANNFMAFATNASEAVCVSTPVVTCWLVLLILL